MKNNQVKINVEALDASQAGALTAELFLNERYLLRRNVLNGKVEFAMKPAEGEEPVWKTLTQRALNSIIIAAKREGVFETGNPRADIVEYVNSDEVDVFNPIGDYLEGLKK